MKKLVLFTPTLYLFICGRQYVHIGLFWPVHTVANLMAEGRQGEDL
jgi:hypothetical protein